MINHHQHPAKKKDAVILNVVKFNTISTIINEQLKQGPTSGYKKNIMDGLLELVTVQVTDKQPYYRRHLWPPKNNCHHS